MPINKLCAMDQDEIVTITLVVILIIIEVLFSKG